MFKPFYKNIKGRKCIKYGIEIFFQQSIKKKKVLIMPLDNSRFF